MTSTTVQPATEEKSAALFKARRTDLYRPVVIGLDAPPKKLSYSVDNRFRRNLVHDLRIWRRRLRSNRLLDDETKRNLLHLARHHVAVVSNSDLRRWRRLSTVHNSIAFAAMFLAFLLSVLNPKMGNFMLGTGWVGVLLIISVSSLLTQPMASRLGARRYFAFLQRLTPILPVLFLIVPILLTFIALINPVDRPVSDPAVTYSLLVKIVGFALACVIGVLMMVVGGSLTVSILAIVNHLSSRGSRIQNPQSFAVDRMCRCLELLDKPGTRRNPMRHQRNLLQAIEDTARVMQDDLPRGLRTPGDISTDEWNRKRCVEIATAFRGLKKWVMSPRQDTSQQLAQRLASDILLAAQGRWDEMPREVLQPLTRTQWWQRLGVFALRTVAGTAVVLLLTHGSKLEPTWVAQNWSNGFALLTTFLPVLAAFDPAFQSKFALFKDALLAPAKSEKDK